MKKSTIWILTIVMACTFVGLLYVEIMYMENMIKMRNQQFDETVMRSLYSVSSLLEQDETKYFLDQDLSEAAAASLSPNATSYTSNEVGLDSLKKHNFQKKPNKNRPVTLNNANHDGDFMNFGESYQDKQEILKGQYLYQKGLLNEVILTILSQSSDRPIVERADSTMVRRYLTQELQSNGLNLPFEFAVVTRNETTVYKTPSFREDKLNKSFSQTLFPNDPVNKQNSLKVYFPTKGDYIFSSIKFMIPSFAFTFLLLFIFVYTIILAFKQKRLSEIKNDFINNMTHEFKTPISTISLAAQMLNDDSVSKSPKMLKHVSGIINDETKRLRFQVEKVLQMSMFDKKKATLRMQDVDANAVIAKVIDTYKIKVEKYGGHLKFDLDAEDSIVNVDEMHFTNVIFNLLDNAVKYRREEVPLELAVSTHNINDDYLEITISDNGIGIKKDDLKKIFDKFYRVSTGNRHDVKGFGLGLAYVSKMITLFKGTIKVESELNKGSKFIITLPLYK